MFYQHAKSYDLTSATAKPALPLVSELGEEQASSIRNIEVACKVLKHPAYIIIDRSKVDRNKTR